MIAFVLGGIVFVCTLLLCALMVFAAGMSDAPSTSSGGPVLGIFITGTIISILLVASHWLPHLNW